MRALETRTKIQLGSLVFKSGLAQLLDIMPGDDLQLDLDKRDQAHALLGILKDAAETLQSNKASIPYYTSKGKSLANEIRKG